jgi:nitroreductase
MDSFLDLVRKRRSIRTYKPDPIPDEHIDKIIEAGRLAPSWANKQCWRFILVADPEKKKAMEPDRDWITTAPVILVLAADPASSGVKADQQYYLLDVGICMEHMILQAAELGLGTCWIGWFDEQTVRRALNVPSSLRVVAFTPIGYPAEEKGQVSDRKPTATILTRESF